jgi:hypothetical protein
MAFSASLVKTVNQVTGGFTDASTMYNMLYDGPSTDLTTGGAGVYEWGLTHGFEGGEFIICQCSDKPVIGYTVYGSETANLVIFAEAAS